MMNKTVLWNVAKIVGGGVLAGLGVKGLINYSKESKVKITEDVDFDEDDIFDVEEESESEENNEDAE